MPKLIMSLLLVLTIGLSGCALLPNYAVDPHTLADPNGQFIDVDGVELYVVTAGDPSNPAVILVHGFGGSTFSWRLTMEPLAEAGYYVIALDRPGFGLSDKSTSIDFRHQAQADLIVGMMDKLNIPIATLVGHSQGGNVVAHVAVHHPDRVAKLVIVAGAIVPTNARPDSAFGSVGNLAISLGDWTDELADSPLLRQLIGLFLRSYFDEARVRELAISAYGDEALVTPEVFEGYYRAFRTPYWERGLIDMVIETEGNLLASEQLQTIAAPTILMWGVDDDWVPLAGGITLNELIPASRLITYADVGHSPMDTVPDQFNADLIGFLAE